MVVAVIISIVVVFWLVVFFVAMSAPPSAAFVDFLLVVHAYVVLAPYPCAWWSKDRVMVQVCTAIDRCTCSSLCHGDAMVHA